jgi:hypothetical protein
LRARCKPVVRAPTFCRPVLISFTVFLHDRTRKVATPLLLHAASTRVPVLSPGACYWQA